MARRLNIAMHFSTDCKGVRQRPPAEKIETSLLRTKLVSIPSTAAKTLGPLTPWKSARGVYCAVRRAAGTSCDLKADEWMPPGA
jgi:hypothetical protein